MAPNLPTAAAATAQAAPIAPPRAQSQQIAAQPANTATAQDTPTQPAQGQQLTPPPLVVPPTPTPSPQQNAAASVAPPTAPAAPPVQDAKAAPAPMKTAPAATNLKAGATPAKGARKRDRRRGCIETGSERVRTQRTERRNGAASRRLYNAEPAKRGARPSGERRRARQRARCAYGGRAG
ncbi:MAG: hypothetical protein NVV62_12060 [Terricaulis sp.]|nr:hypothetical protein [Terricaulis sp.]